MLAKRAKRGSEQRALQALREVGGNEEGRYFVVVEGGEIGTTSISTQLQGGRYTYRAEQFIFLFCPGGFMSLVLRQGILDRRHVESRSVWRHDHGRL